MKNAAFLSIILFSLLLASCSAKAKWFTKLDDALQSAGERQKPIFLLFSGEDWDGATPTFKKDVLDTRDFAEDFKNDYVLVKLDFSQSEYAKTVLDENSSPKQREEADRILAEYDEKERLASLYGLNNQYPCVYLLSKEGYVLCAIPYSEAIKSVADLENLIGIQQSVVTQLSSLIERVNASEGAEKAKAIDALYEATPEAYRLPLAPLTASVASLDAQNTSGLRGKYELISAWNNAMIEIQNGDTDATVDKYLAACEGGMLSPDQKQEAYYTAAYMMAVLGSSDFDRMYSLLQKSMEAAPESGRAADITLMMNEIREMQQRFEEAGSR